MCLVTSLSPHWQLSVLFHIFLTLISILAEVCVSALYTEVEVTEHLIKLLQQESVLWNGIHEAYPLIVSGVAGKLQTHIYPNFGLQHIFLGNDGDRKWAAC